MQTGQRNRMMPLSCQLLSPEFIACLFLSSGANRRWTFLLCLWVCAVCACTRVEVRGQPQLCLSSLARSLLGYARLPSQGAPRVCAHQSHSSFFYGSSCLPHSPAEPFFLVGFVTVTLGGNKCWPGCGERGTVVTAGGSGNWYNHSGTRCGGSSQNWNQDCHMTQLHHSSTYQRVPKPAHHSSTCPAMVIAAAFAKVTEWNQPRCPSSRDG